MSCFLYFCVNRFISLDLPVVPVINSIKLLIMKDFFIKTFRGHQFEFTRVLATSYDPWPYTKKVFVLSTSLKEVPGSVKEKVIILSMPPKDLLSYLSGLGILNICIDGGSVIQNFLKEDLVDELIIAKAPILIGSGIPLFNYLDIDLQFRHIKTQIQTNGLVRSYYERIRK